MKIAVRRCAAGAAAWFFHASLCTRLAGSKVTPFSPEARLLLQNMCFPEDVIVIAGYNEFSATDRFRFIAVVVAGRKCRQWMAGRAVPVTAL